MSFFTVFDHYLEANQKKGDNNYHGSRKWRDKIFLPLIKLFYKLGIRANGLSLIGLLVLLGFVIFVVSKPWLAVIFLLLNLLIDGMDGVMARYAGTSSLAGAFTDSVIDLTSMAVIVATLFLVGLINPILAIIYIYFSVMWMFFRIVRYHLKKPIRLLLRSDKYIFCFYILWVLTGWNVLNEVVLMLLVLVIPLTILSFVKLFKYLKIYQGDIKNH